MPGFVHVHINEDDEDFNLSWNDLRFEFFEVFKGEQGAEWDDQRPMQWYNELWVVKSGRCEVQLGERQAIAQAGDIVLLPFGVNRRTRNLSSLPFGMMGIYFQIRLLPRLDVLSSFELPLVFRARDSYIESLLEQIYGEATRKSLGFNFKVSGLAQIALAEVIRTALPPDEDMDQFKRRVISNLKKGISPETAKVLQLIEHKFAQPLTVEDLAEEAHISMRQLTRRFKAELKVTPLEYLLAYRLRKAHDRILDCHKSIAQIAFETGFEDASYFTRMFKKKFGMTPSQVREKEQASC